MDAAHIKLLQRMPVFGAVNDETLRFILEGSTTLTVPEGEEFFREGDPAEAFYVLESGRVEVLRDYEGGDFLLTELGPGDCFGEMALIECAPRSAAVKALEPCTALEIGLGVLHALYEHDLEQFVLIQMNLAREVSRRLRGAAEQLFTAKVVASEIGGNYRWYLL